MLVIPAIDIFDGKCVRLTEGSFLRRMEYSDSPTSTAERFRAAGATKLHVVDLEGASKGRFVNFATVEAILSLGGIEVEVGGGVRTIEDVERLISAGAASIVLGSALVQKPDVVESWIQKLGAHRFIAAMDFKDSLLATEGWQKTQELDVDHLVKRFSDWRIRRCLSTDIRRDGTLSGPNLSWYRHLVESYPHLEWIASGGVRSPEDLTALESAGIRSVVVGKALYEGQIPMETLKND